VIAPSGEQITITAGDQQAVVVEVGGGLRSYSAGASGTDGHRSRKDMGPRQGSWPLSAPGDRCSIVHIRH
jgi:hypothetical protein